MLPIGVRQNNPGNIRPGDPWQGLDDRQAANGFCWFKAPEWGFRAMARNLIAYYDGARGATPCRTVRSIVSRWAPPEDNNPTEAYIKAVCHTTGFGPDEPLNLHGYDDAWKLCRAMTIQEQGGFEAFFTKDQLDEGLRLAGCEGCPPAKPKRSIGVMVTTAAGAAVTAGPVAYGTAVGARGAIESLFGPSKFVPIAIGLIFGVLFVVEVMRTRKS